MYIDKDALKKFLFDKWEDSNCPKCKNNQWTVPYDVFEIKKYLTGKFIIGGEVIPVIPITCMNCGLTFMVNAIIAGIVKKTDKEKAADKEFEKYMKEHYERALQRRENEEKAES